MSQNLENEGLFIKKFRTRNRHYIYSPTSNEIAAVDADIWRAVDLFKYGDNKNQEGNGVDQSIQELVDSGVWGYKRPEIRVDFKDVEKLQEVFKRDGIGQLILNLTNQCNMRCRYCTFSGHYKYKRNHEEKHMELETACRAVDYFFSNSHSSKKRAITFYGGEVLTRFDVLKEIVTYIRSIDKDLSISFTTNGTLLSEKVIQYLIHNGIGINVSLDGDKDIHDGNRLLRSGSGSFETIMGNLKRIKDLDSNYFREKISYISVLTPPYQSEKLKEFFSHSEFFDSMQSVMVAPVNLRGSFLFKKSELIEFKSQYDRASKKMLKAYEDSLIEEKSDRCMVEKQWFKDLIGGIHFREKSTIEGRLVPLGQCVPGSRRLFVSVDGNFYMCEQVGEHYSIGDLEKGINFERVSQFFNQWESYFKACSSCWAVRICKKCFAEFHSNGEFNEVFRENYCSSALKFYENLLETYCRVLEQNSDAFGSFRFEDYS